MVMPNGYAHAQRLPYQLPRRAAWMVRAWTRALSIECTEPNALTHQATLFSAEGVHYNAALLLHCGS